MGDSAIKIEARLTPALNLDPLRPPATDHILIRSKGSA